MAYYTSEETTLIDLDFAAGEFVPATIYIVDEEDNDYIIDTVEGKVFVDDILASDKLTPIDFAEYLENYYTYDGEEVSIYLFSSQEQALDTLYDFTAVYF